MTSLDTETIPLGGTIVLDVEFDGQTINAVDFRSLAIDYLVDFENPAVFFNVPVAGAPGEGTTVETRLPFDVELSTGNSVALSTPKILLDLAGAGPESGTGATLTLSSPDYSVEGTTQGFNGPLAPDGFPFQLAPFPLTSFPAQGGPQPPDSLDGDVLATTTPGVFTFEGSFFSSGTGGLGLLQSAQIHDGAFVALSLPGDYTDDGIVGAADYTAFRDTVGQPLGALPNDIASTPIGAPQYDTFTNFFGTARPPAPVVELPPESPNNPLSAVAATVATPEPTSLLLLAVGVASTATRRHTRRGG